MDYQPLCSAHVEKVRKMGYFFQGLTMGLAYVAPIGLQNLFVINAATRAGVPY